MHHFLRASSYQIMHPSITARSRFSPPQISSARTNSFIWMHQADARYTDSMCEIELNPICHVPFDGMQCNATYSPPVRCSKQGSRVRILHATLVWWGLQQPRAHQPKTMEGLFVTFGSSFKGNKDNEWDGSLLEALDLKLAPI